MSPAPSPNPYRLITAFVAHLLSASVPKSNAKIIYPCCEFPTPFPITNVPVSWDWRSRAANPLSKTSIIATHSDTYLTTSSICGSPIQKCVFLINSLSISLCH